jgi:hypothetical protein
LASIGMVSIGAGALRIQRELHPLRALGVDEPRPDRRIAQSHLRRESAGSMQSPYLFGVVAF